MFQFQFLWVMDLLVVAGTNGLRFHHSSTSESTSAAQVNLPLLIMESMLKSRTMQSS